MITVLCVPGTFEPHSVGRPAGMLRGIANRLPGDRFDCRQVNYPASYGNPMAYADSVEAGVRELIAAVRRTPNPAALIGFSQGAVVVARLAAEIRAGMHSDLDVRLVVTIANPERAAGEYVRECEPFGRRLTGSGVAGGRSLRGCPFPVLQYAIDGDVITNASPDSLVRDLADLSDYMSPDIARWAEKVAVKLHDRDIQNLSRWENWLLMLGRTPGRVQTALTEIGGYPRVHCEYGTRRMPGLMVTYIDHAAGEMRRVLG